MSKFRKKSLDYHSKKPHGKIGISLNKPLDTQEDLSLAYSPGVAEPCLKIFENTESIYDYTFKGNTVAVVSNGSAVLGLGDIGPKAALPVMEGKSGLMKKFADIDSWPIVLDKTRNENGRTNIDSFCLAIRQISPTFGGINLEDIGAPECFDIEEKLQNIGIPVFHDDQHGTAIISLAGLINSLKIVNKKIEDIKVVINGAGAAGIATANYYVHAGVKKENLILCDSKGPITTDRKDLNRYKQKYAINSTAKNLFEALQNADVFVGVSVADILEEKDIKAMNSDPIIFAMANPDPEISPDKASKYGAKIIATGRSDFPNQINNVLGFPGIFRGALDSRSPFINFEMKLAASLALAELAEEKIDKNILSILKSSYSEDYKNDVFTGDNPMKGTYIIPKPYDPRVVPRVARKVFEAAMKTGIAQIKIEDLDQYERQLFIKLKRSN